LSSNFKINVINWLLSFTLFIVTINVMINETLELAIARLARKAATMPNSVSALFLPNDTDISVANGRLLEELQLFRAVQSTRTLQYERAMCIEVWTGGKAVSQIWVLHPCSPQAVGKRWNGLVALTHMEIPDLDSEDRQFALLLLPCLMPGVEVAKVT
jgi:hypothetical protein